MGSLLAAADMKALSFAVLAALTLGSAGVVALSRNIIYSTIGLLGTFLGVAGLYITLSADFLAAVQILVYVGGTLTLILFAVMLTARIENVRASNVSVSVGPRVAAVVVIGLMLTTFGTIAAKTPWPVHERPQVPATAKLGHAFLDAYLLPFELASVLLLAAMIGAVIIARRAVKREWEHY